MSQADAPSDLRAFVEAMVAAINARDYDRLAELLDPQSEFRSLLAVAEGDRYIGVDGVRRWAQNVDATWEDFKIELVGFHQVDDERAVGAIRNTGRARESGIPLDEVRGCLVTWRDGRGLRNEMHASYDEALRAGVS